MELMIEVNGKYGAAKIFTDVVDQESISQVIELLNQPYAENSHVRMMPDIHAGAGCTIGTTMTISNKVCPNLVGVDIGCGMLTAKLREKNIDLEKLDEVIRWYVPSGFEIRKKPHPAARFAGLEHLNCADHVDIDRAMKSIGTLGGGNHFIEADKDDEGNVYLVIHSGSRHLGLEIAKFYQNAGYAAMKSKKEEIEAAIQRLKAEGRYDEIQATVEAMKKKGSSVPKDLAYVEGELMAEYLEDMGIAQKYAMLNRNTMLDVIVEAMDLHVEEKFTTVHNYIDLDSFVLRKGAVSAKAGEKLLIPINMRDGSLLCVGKGNPDWNYSAPHGAGRLMSRSAAKSAFTVDAFKKEMEGIYTTSVSRGTLDECPMAYKPIEAIVDNIGPTAEIVSVIKPIYNFKAGE